jgi:hypothetical protein
VTRTARAAALVAVLGLSSCGVQGLNFRQDERLVITAPEDRAKVTLPVTVSWRVHDFTVTGNDGSSLTDAGYFGVYVDRAPQPPEQTQVWLVRDDPNCQGVVRCATRSYLAQLNVFSTSRQRFTVERLPAPTTNAPRRREFHDVTIVLLNGRGQRIGESAFTLQFEIDRSD